MIIYNVTLKVDNDIVSEWKEWMIETHIPEMMGTGLFLKYDFNKLLEQEESDGITFIVQYHCASQETYQQYLEEYADDMRQMSGSKYGDKMVGFRTLMLRIEEG